MAVPSGSLPLSAWNAWASAGGKAGVVIGLAGQDGLPRERARPLPCGCRSRLSQDVGLHP